MHILQINSVYGIRSTGRIVKELHEFLLENGHKSTIVYSEGPYIKDGYKISGDLDKKIHALMSRITGLQGYFSKRQTKKTLEFISEKNPDIVHIHNLHSNFINMPMLFEYLANNNIATVITLHDCWFFTGGHTHYTIDQYYDWEKGFSKKNKNKKFMGNKSWFFDRTEKIFNDQIKWFTKIPRLSFVGVSQWITEEARKSQTTKGADLQTIYNWIDLEVFKHTENSSLIKKMGIENKFLILGVASGWSNNKGLDKFVELSYHINNDEIIVLVGNIPQGSDIPKNIINIPETHNIEELVNYYSHADVFLNFSSEESFGKVSVEALACGTPVITNKYTANPELLTEGCGYVIDNIRDALEKIKVIKKNKREFYSINCIRFIHDNFNSINRMNDHLELYEMLIERDVLK